MSIEVSKKISFIIPHKGREEMLVQTVSSIFEQDFDLSLVEVLVVTQNDALDCLTEFDDSVFKVIYPEKGLTISANRNFGANQAQGDYFAFLDADVALSGNWINSMLELLAEDPNRKLVSAKQINSDNPPVLEQIRTALSNAELDCNVSFLPGRNLFLHKDTFWQVGGFPEHLVTCEDYYFTDKVNELGDLYYSSRAEYVHIGEDKALKPMFDKEVWRGQSNLQSIQGRSVPLRELPSFFIPPVMIVGLLLSVILSVLGFAPLATLAALMFFLPLMAYSLRLYRLADKQISFFEILKFYLVYFPARAKGTILGLSRTITANN